MTTHCRVDLLADQLAERRHLAVREEQREAMASTSLLCDNDKCNMTKTHSK